MTFAGSRDMLMVGDDFEPKKFQATSLKRHPHKEQGTMTAHPENREMLASLALALVDQPRASLQELARAIGVSKATLYRFCPTRDRLIERLMAYGVQAISEAIAIAELDRDSPIEALKRLIENSLKHRELILFMSNYWEKTTAPDLCSAADWDAALDGFFLRGQQQGVFRIDIAAPALTEIWSSLVIGLLEAERRGRVARVGLTALMETAFLNGTLAR